MAIIDNLQKISDTVWELPPSYKQGMRVPARIIATEKLVRDMDEAVYQQISNVATLPGIARYALCMPDGHSGYGFPIGGVAAMDVHEGGVISPGGIGFDINCGMRLITTNLTLEDVQPRLKEIVDRLFQRVPAGIGVKGRYADQTMHAHLRFEQSVGEHAVHEKGGSANAGAVSI